MQIYFDFERIMASVFFLGSVSLPQACWILHLVYHYGFTFRETYEKCKPVSKPQGGFGQPEH